MAKEDVERFEELDDLFTGNLDSKMDFLDDSSNSRNNDGIYRVDLEKVKDKKKGWKSVIRFLPNITKEGKVEQSAIEKITHYVDIKNNKDLSGWFDSPKNFKEDCPLTKLYYAMKESKNAILVEKSKMLKYSKKYYSYVLVLEDEQQPELVGKIMIFQYGKIIRDKILSEKNGDITGEECTVFDISQGKDFVLIVKETQTEQGELFPDYKMSMFRPEKTSLPIYSKEKETFKNLPLNENKKVDSKYGSYIKTFLLDREHELEEFAPKRLTEEQQSKITEISNFLVGKSSKNYPQKKESQASSDDFEFDENFNEEPSKSSFEESEDDFFSDIE
jgi:hypothetical protein